MSTFKLRKRNDLAVVSGQLYCGRNENRRFDQREKRRFSFSAKYSDHNYDLIPADRLIRAPYRQTTSLT